MNNIEMPYITIQCLLREFSKALGTKKLAAKEIDNACKQVEINPYQLQKLKMKLIHDPLSKHVNVYFADHVLSQIDSVFKQYLYIVQTIELDGVNAKKAQKLIGHKFISMSAAFVCTEVLDSLRITPKELANSGQTAMQAVFDNFKGSTTWRKHFESATKEQKDRYRMWSKGKDGELPDIEGIGAIGDLWSNDRDWGVIKARLVIAHIWDYFFYRSGLCDLTIVGTMDIEQQWKSLVESLQLLQRKESEQYRISTPTALELYEVLRLRKSKLEDDKNKCQLLLERLKQYQDELDHHHETTYYYHWMEARYHLHCGELNRALISYKLAYEQSMYRAGENIGCIIKEAILVASRLQKPDKAFINKLRSMAAVFGFDILPNLPTGDTKKKPEVIEEWEISAYAQYFEHYFTKASFFPEAEYPKFYDIRHGAWLVNETKYTVNVNTPNKMLKVGEAGLLVKRMPQLVYFAMNDDIAAVNKLIEAGASVNKLSESNESVLLMAVQALQVNLCPLNSMRDDLLKVITSKQHTKETVNAITTKRKLTALGCAVQTGRLDVVKAVIELGAEIDQRHDVGGETPLFTCIGLITQHKRPWVPIALAEAYKYSDQNLNAYMAYSAGFVPHDKEELKQVIKSKEADPIFLECKNVVGKYISENIKKHTSIDGFREIAKYLIEKGADVNARHDTALLGYTPLMLAAELDEAELFYLMAKAKGNINDSCINPENNRRMSCREIARYWRSQSVIALFR